MSLLLIISATVGGSITELSPAEGFWALSAAISILTIRALLSCLGGELCAIFLIGLARFGLLLVDEAAAAAKCCCYCRRLPSADAEEELVFVMYVAFFTIIWLLIGYFLPLALISPIYFPWLAV